MIYTHQHKGTGGLLRAVRQESGGIPFWSLETTPDQQNFMRRENHYLPLNISDAYFQRDYRAYTPQVRTAPIANEQSLLDIIDKLHRRVQKLEGKNGRIEPSISKLVAGSIKCDNRLNKLENDVKVYDTSGKVVYPPVVTSGYIAVAPVAAGQPVAQVAPSYMQIMHVAEAKKLLDGLLSTWGGLWPEWRKIQGKHLVIRRLKDTGRSNLIPVYEAWYELNTFFSKEGSWQTTKP